MESHSEDILEKAKNSFIVLPKDEKLKHHFESFESFLNDYPEMKGSRLKELIAFLEAEVSEI
jgi:hypothetical protein